MQACSGIATLWFLLTVIHFILVRSNRKSSCHYKGKIKLLKKNLHGSLRKLPSAPNMVKKMPSVIFPPCNERFAKVDLQGIKTWKHLKYQ